MVTVGTFKRGVLNAFRTAFELLKVIIPVYALMTVLSYTPVIGWIAKFFSPLMNVVGLPGEAALALVIGWFVNIYTAVGVIIGLHLSVWQITVIAVMMNFAHELVVETAVIKKTGVSVLPILITRIGGAFVLGGLLNFAHNFLV